jgi:hypothetical protein
VLGIVFSLQNKNPTQWHWKFVSHCRGVLQYAPVLGIVFSLQNKNPTQWHWKFVSHCRGVLQYAPTKRMLCSNRNFSEPHFRGAMDFALM